jgi:hypothetical protein
MEIGDPYQLSSSPGHRMPFISFSKRSTWKISCGTCFFRVTFLGILRDVRQFGHVEETLKRVINEGEIGLDMVG